MNQDLVAELINALTILPGVGKKSAQRMALYLLDRNKDGASILANTLNKAVENVQRCSSCRMLTSNILCNICSDKSRDASSICVVESPSDVLAIESTGGYKGSYFVLLGRLSPIDGVGPTELGINDLLKRINLDGVKNLVVEYGKCCNPIPGDEVVGYISRGRGLIVHMHSCSNLSSLSSKEERLVSVNC